MGLSEIAQILRDCLGSWGIWIALLLAFLLAGAVITFIPAVSVARHLGAGVSRAVAYLVGSTSGLLLPVCPCNIVPLFMSILRSGAGLGPAVTLLYAGPAMNLITLVFVFQVMGWRLGVWRALAVPLVSVLLGFTAVLLHRPEGTSSRPVAPSGQSHGMVKGFARRLGLFLGLLTALLVVETIPLGTWTKVGAGGALLVGLAIAFAAWFSLDDFLDWMTETLRLLKTVLPVLVVSAVLIAVLAAAVPSRVILSLVGKNDGPSVLLASVFGCLMPFPILAEVVFAKCLCARGMAVGPACSVLLTGPSLGLPGLLLVRKVLGVRSTVIYAVVLIALGSAAGWLFGQVGGG